MYKLICNKLKNNGYNHYEISNFSKYGYESKHNLTYWNNFEYYGFGLGASGYYDDIRYENTRSFNKYLNGEYIKEYLSRFSIEANVVGEVTDSNTLILTYGDEQAEVFNQDENPVFIFK